LSVGYATYSVNATWISQMGVRIRESSRCTE
jgi:hypothetical protein